MDERIDPERVARVVAALAVGESDPRASLCSASAGLVDMTGAGVVLLSDRRTLGNVCVSDAVTQRVEDLQYALGEGPCVDAFRTREPVLVADLEAIDGRWSAFRKGALAAGMRAAFGFPLIVGPSCIGALNLFHDRPGALTDNQFADALTIAHVAARTVLAWQVSVGPGAVPWQLEQVPAHRAVVHQATGIISVQAGVPIDDALVLLRAHAFAEERLIGEVAEDVVGGVLRFD